MSRSVTLPSLIAIGFLMTSFTDGDIFDCIKFPRPPLNGRLRYTDGDITARLLCSKPGHDLPLTAPGNGGILTCSPKEKTFDFVNAKPQECLPYKAPSGLHLPAKFTFIGDECDANIKKDVTKAVRDKLQEIVPQKCSSLLKDANCTWQNLKIGCDDYINMNRIKIDGQNSQKILAVNCELMISAYDPKIPVKRYQTELERIYSSYLSKFTIPGNNQLAVKFKDMFFYRSWIALCSQYGDTVQGTKLEYHRVASCRGCPMTFFLHPRSKKCWLCDRGFWTPAPFASTCTRCPRVEHWDSPERYVQMCGSLE